MPMTVISALDMPAILSPLHIIGRRGGRRRPLRLGLQGGERPRGRGREGGVARGRRGALEARVRPIAAPEGRRRRIRGSRGCSGLRPWGPPLRRWQRGGPAADERPKLALQQRQLLFPVAAGGAERPVRAELPHQEDRGVRHMRGVGGVLGTTADAAAGRAELPGRHPGMQPPRQARDWMNMPVVAIRALKDI